jgi:hypothetical protein
LQGTFCFLFRFSLLSLIFFFSPNKKYIFS